MLESFAANAIFISVHGPEHFIKQENTLVAAEG